VWVGGVPVADGPGQDGAGQDGAGQASVGQGGSAQQGLGQAAAGPRGAGSGGAGRRRPGWIGLGWFRRLSLRGRLILIGVSGVAVALALGGVLLVTALRLVLLNAVDDGARQTAHSVVGLIEAGEPPNLVPTAGTQYVQVLDDGSAVRAASIGADRLVALLTPGELRAARAGRVLTVGGDRLGLTGELRVLAESTGSGAGARTVVVAVPVQNVRQSVVTVRYALFVAYPLMLAGLAVLAWRVVGWTLRPVEALRAGAEEISASHSGRLPVPDGDDEVHRLALTLNRMLDRLESARTRQRAFVADAAHELRSPIASLRTQIEVADHLGEAAPTADLCAEVDRLARLVDDLLLLARADERDPGLRRCEPVELTGLLTAAAAGWSDARVSVTPPYGSPQWAKGDPVALRRVADNLLSNACRHATTGVALDVVRVGRRVLVTVTDDGPGISERDRSRVFDRFTRLDDARARDQGGTGLGLPIVRELVRLHGGSVTLGDARGTGRADGAGRTGGPGPAAGPGLRVTVDLPATDP
jgi:signal transduction histidine kinase